MTGAYVILVLPLLTAVCAWLIFLHLARSGRAVRRRPDDLQAVTRAAVERVREFNASFALVTEATMRASESFRTLAVQLAAELERALRASKDRASGG